MIDPARMEELWDAKYADSDQVWSGEPNGVLVQEASDMWPGTVLDVGCGEGADAIWLADHGWTVTALDVSNVGLERARTAAAAAGVTVEWLHAGLLDAELPATGFDVVVALYPALLRTPDHAAEAALLDAVKPGGTLLFVHHDIFGSQPSRGQHPTGPAGEGHSHGPGSAGHHGGPGQHGGGGGGGLSPSDMVGVEDMKTFLTDNDAWQIETHEARDRDVQQGAGAHFTRDLVFKARRLH